MECLVGMSGISRQPLEGDTYEKIISEMKEEIKNIVDEIFSPLFSICDIIN